MREIKFRAWSKKTKQMVEVNDLHLPWRAEHFDLMQYTGLKDKNGKEIYEGDIVKVLEKGTWYTGEVAYALCGFFMKPLKANPYFGRLHFTESENGSGRDGGTEVIGNIYENPDLLVHPKE